MAGAFLTMFLLMFGLIGGFVAGSISRTRRREGVGLAVLALASIYIAGSASHVGIRIGLFALIIFEIIVCYLDSVIRAKEAQNSETKEAS